MRRFPTLTLLSLLALLVLGCVRVKPVEQQAMTPTADGESAPAVPVGDPFDVEFETSKGKFLVEVHPEWAPRGAARFRELVESGFFDETRFFRVVPGFMVQWGINGTPEVQAKWRDANILDDPVRESNKPGMMTFATSGANSRTTQLFINYGDNAASLDPQGFAPFARVTQGMEVVRAINSEYRERPDQGRIQTEGNRYLDKNFPNLDYIIKTRLIEKAAAPAEETPQAQSSPTQPAPTAETVVETAAPESANSAETPKETIEEIR